MKPKIYTPTQAREKIRHYCAYQERSHMEVRNKLYSYGLHSSDVDEILIEVIGEGFLNEERYAKAFAGGKFRIKKWGRTKIKHELEANGLTKNCIKTGLLEIDEKDYQTTLISLLTKKLHQLEEDNFFVKKDKAAKYAIQKGFEPELVWQVLKDFPLK